jgi:hypothetical protein
MGKQCAFQLSHGMLTKRPQTKPFLPLSDVTLPIPIRCEVFVVRVVRYVDLIGDKRQKS